MVSFSCEACGDVLTKKKLDPHRGQCRGATFTCLDCMVHFQGTEYRSHTSCISEAQKYQGHLYREKTTNNSSGGGGKANKGEKRKSLGASGGDMAAPRKAYVEDAPEEGDNEIAVIDVPPRAPTPPPIEDALPANINVFDYLITDEQSTTTNGHAAQPVDESRMITESHQYSQLSNGHSSHFSSRGFSYGNAPVEPTFERYDSWSQFPSQSQPLESQQSIAAPAYITKIVTPGPDREKRHKDDKSDKKRKRVYIDDLDLSATKRPASRDEPMTDAPNRILHTGLTGGLTRLITDAAFYEDRIDAGPTPISPMKRSKRDKDLKDAAKRISSYGSGTTKISSTTKHSLESDVRQSRRTEHEQHEERRRRRHRSPSSSSDEGGKYRDRRQSKVKAIDFKPHDGSRNSSVQPTSKNQLIKYTTRADLFLSFVTKGPESERGCSINKALKRYHRDCMTRGDDKDEDDKDLWKSLRLRKNERGEIVLFVA